ncbi:transmembrane protein 179B isoform 2-T2 [Rhynchocyon petersi]
MALSWPQRVELALFAASFLCGAVTAAALTRTQVRLGPIGLRIALAISFIAIFLILVTACVLRFGTISLCSSIISLKTTSCPEAQKIPWTPPGTAVQFYSNLHNAETSSWVNLVLWGLILVLQVIQWKLEVAPHRPLEKGAPEWSSETDALFGPRFPHS